MQDFVFSRRYWQTLLALAAIAITAAAISAGLIGFKPTSVEGALLESAQNVLLLAQRQSR